MKKIILICFTILCFCGVGYLGYLIFNKSSIESVELYGNIQTLYIVGEDLDYQDAKLKLTYKNGDIKIVDITSKNVKVTNFSTSVEKNGIMKLTYKSHTIEVEYNVIYQGLYYMTSDVLIDADDYVTPQPATYSQSSSPMLVYVGAEGRMDYYYKTSGTYYMHDGTYDSTYRYDIKDDTLRLYFGKDEPLNVKADYKTTSGITLISTKLNTKLSDPSLVVSKEVKTYKHCPTFLETRRITNLVAPDDVFTLKKGQTIKSSGLSILLQVRYGYDTFMNTVYVHFADGMIRNNSLNTSGLTSIAFMDCCYDGEDFEINYKVTL